MGPKAYAVKSTGIVTSESSWMERMCQKLDSYCDLGEPGRGPLVLMQEVEVHFSNFGAGFRKLANEANELVLELLNVPIVTTTDRTGEKVVDLPKQRDVKVVQGEKQVAKQAAKQPAAAPMNFFDEACMKLTSKDEAKEGRDTKLNGDVTNLKVLSVKDDEDSPFGEVTWDWPQQPFIQSSKAVTDQRLLQEVGQASCSSVELAGVAVEATENMKVETTADGEDVKGSNDMFKGEEESASWSSLDDVKESQRDMSAESSLLDGWEGDDIVINEEDLEPDSWHDWELV